MKKVVIIKSVVKIFRLPFYNQLIPLLKRENIELQLIFGQPDKFHDTDKDIVWDIPFGKRIQNRYLYFGRRLLIWQPALKYIRNADLVIVQQGNAHILNYLLIVIRKIFGYKLAFWGHGRNFQATNSNSISERLKRLYSVHVDHWFAYNDLSAEIVRKLGYPEDRITSVNNAIDVTERVRLLNEIPPSKIEKLRKEFGIAKHDAVGIFCSRLYPEKRLSFLLRCVEKVKQLVPRFHFFVIGDGVEASVVKAFAEKNSGWFHWVGARYGREKVQFFRLAQFQLMPGLVGLHIVESFALLTPIVTTDIDIHSPEIDYLENGTNGIITADSVDAYVRAIVDLIHDDALLKQLLEGCREARERYTIENMAERFCQGIIQTLRKEPP